MPNESDNTVGALAGLRVLEVGHLIAGPFCGHLFADHGAEVIKIEPPGGDPMRHWGRDYRGIGLYWPIIARGKKSVTLDLRTDGDRQSFRQLARGADVVIENMRPGVMERWGLGPDDLRTRNEKLIMVRISGYGQTGPYSDQAGYGLVAEAMSGFRHLSGELGRAPVRVGISIGDSLAATQGFIGALMALWRRDRPGGTAHGQVIDVALYEAMFMYMESIAAEYDKLTEIRQPAGPTLPGIAPSNAYPTADKQWVLIGANQDSVFARLASAIGRPDWAEPPSPFVNHVGRGAAQAELDGLIAEWTAAQSLDAILDHMAAAGVPAGHLYTAADIVADPHYAAREMLIHIDEPNLNNESVLHPGVVPKLSGTPGRIRRGAPLLGEHNDEIRAELEAVA